MPCPYISCATDTLHLTCDPLQAATVLPDANMQLALRATTFAALGTSGQRCTSTRRLFLHSSIAPHFLSSLTSAYKKITAERMGHPLDSNTLVGPLHTRDAVKRFENAIATARKQGGEILAGGNVVQMEGDLSGGNWVEPTIVLVKDVERCEIMKQETFAPSGSFPLSRLLAIKESTGH
jgi:aldehyde dehydrogenase family 7 protein A1